MARWARQQVASQNTSVSRLVGELLKERMQREAEYEAAMQRALARRPFLKTDGRYLAREQVHERSRLR